MLKELARHGNIVIQCHDVPDADAVACAFALRRCLEAQGAHARLVYSGGRQISKPNLLLMLKLLNIPLEYVEALPPCALLVTVDCQYGAGNLRKFEAARVAVLDHHRPEIEEGPMVIIRPELGSCSTLLWSLMRAHGFDFAAQPEVFNALYYGLYSDTNGLAEMRHPLDRDLADFMPVDGTLLRKLKNSALTVAELEVVADALSAPRLVGGIALLKARPCDPNILGFSSDIAQQVEQFDSCVAYCHWQAGLKLSVRSTVREVMANELALFLAEGAGSGGGNIEKAGGYISFDGIAKIAPGMTPDEFLLERVARYQSNFDLIYCNRHNMDFAAMPRFRKEKIPLGYARAVDIFPAGAPISIRTLEGDIDTEVSCDTYLMIWIAGEVYPIKEQRYHEAYTDCGQSYALAAAYQPAIIHRLSGERKFLLPFARACMARSDKIIRAQALVRDAKVFSNWDQEKYFRGRAGDFIAAAESDFSDIYIINRDIFAKTYAMI
jgi:phosphoglycolate phosphatase